MASAEEAADLLGSLAAGGVLAGAVEGLLARLLTPAQNDDGEGGGSDAGDTTAGSCGGERAGNCDGVSADHATATPGLFADEEAAGPGSDAALVTAAEKTRMVGAEEVAATGLMALGAEGLGELAAACRRLAAWAAWGEALAAACLTGCPELSAHPGQWGPGGEVSPVVGFEERRFNATCLLSARLGVSRSQAGRVVDHGQVLMEAGYGPTEAMERAGVLDSAKASLVTRRLEGVPTLVALEVQERVLPQAPRRSYSQVGRDLDRALMILDPEGHAERAQVNTARRCVSRPRPAGEGVSRIRMLLPIMDAFLLDATLDAIAASARAAGETRTLGQLRADAMTTMTLSTLRTSQQAACAQPARGCGGDAGGASDSCCSADGIAHAEGQAGSSDSGVPASWPAAPEDARACRDPRAARGSWAVSGTRCSRGEASPRAGDPRGGEPDQNHTEDPKDPEDIGDTARADHLDSTGKTLSTTSGRGLPGSGGPALSAPSEAVPPLIGTVSGTNTPLAGGGSLPDAGLCPCAEGPAQTDPSAARPVEVARPSEGAGVVEATSVAEVTVGARSVAVPAVTAWALAAGGTWRRLVTDPVSGVLLDVGRTRYRPPADLADLVRARDRACVFPTCQTPANRCDIDHLTPWSQGGTTSLDNLVTLCQAHHRLKHTPGWALTRDRDTQVLSWHTPDRTVYQRHPDGTITRQPRTVGPRQHHVPGTVIPEHLSAQITPELIDRLNTALDHALSSAHRTRLPRDTDPRGDVGAGSSDSAGRGSGRVGLAPPARPAGPTGQDGVEPGFTGPGTLTTHGPRPGQRAGDYETTPYPDAAHTLGLAPLIDTVPPF